YVMAYLLNPIRGEYSYDYVAAEYLELTVPSAKETDAATSSLIEADIAIKAYDELLKQIQSANMLSLYMQIELPLTYVLDSMEKEGIKAEKEALKEYGNNLDESIEKLAKSIYSAAGEEFNINSPKQLGVILFEKLGIQSGKKTKTGYSTAADVLEKLSVDYPIVKDILEYRTLTKLKSTYADGLINYIREDGRIHTSFNQTVTATGRLSSADPNLQNIPIRMELGRLIRKVFVPKKGYTFVDADYSQIELRLLAHMSGDDNLIAAYKSGKDIHKMTASKAFNVPFEEVTDDLRRKAKAVNFGIVYGISAFGLSEDLHIPQKMAAEYIENYFKAYPKIKDYLDGLINYAKDKGYAITLYNRRRQIPEIKESAYMTRQFGERVAMNAPIQGTAADIMKSAMINVYRRLKNDKVDAKILVQVHDELLIEAADSEVEKVYVILEEEMCNASKLSVDLIVDIHDGKDWYEAK
nr:DNA polymerase I [Lachnospiraceae bacterium]